MSPFLACSDPYGISNGKQPTKKQGFFDFHLCPEMHLTLNLGTSYKTDLFVVGYDQTEIFLNKCTTFGGSSLYLVGLELK